MLLAFLTAAKGALPDCKVGVQFTAGVSEGSQLVVMDNVASWRSGAACSSVEAEAIWPESQRFLRRSDAHLYHGSVRAAGEDQ